MAIIRNTIAALLLWAVFIQAALDTVQLQLKWKHQFQFAGYYAAIQQGYYQDAGLAVNLLEAEAGVDPTDAVLQGKAEFGIGSSDLVIRRAKGDPIVVLAAIFQHSPLAIMTRADTTIRSVHDLVHHKLMFESNASEILTYLVKEKIPRDSVNLVPHTFTIRDFLEHRIDAMTVYTTDEVYDMRRMGIPFALYSPRSAGLDFYGDNLFTTEAQIKKNPKRVEAFRKASLRGWEYALTHQSEIIHFIREHYSTRHDSTQLAFEASAMQPLIGNPLVPIGYMYTGRWQGIADAYYETSLLPQAFAIDGFLYRNEELSPPTNHSSNATAIGLLVVAGLLVAFVLGTNSKLRQQIDVNAALRQEMQRAQTTSERSRNELVITLRELERWATTDKLTELPNRRHLEQRGETEVARAHRYSQPLTAILIDLDHFKQINDLEGHHMGDAVLVDIAKVIATHVRVTDLPGRWGGEEFLVLVPSTPPTQAIVLAEKLRSAIELHHFPCSPKVTASFGIANLQKQETLDALLRRADQALYVAKANGRNRVEQDSPADFLRQ